MPSPGPADVSSFLPFLNTDRGRDAEMTSPTFNLGFVNATRRAAAGRGPAKMAARRWISALRQEMQLGR